MNWSRLITIQQIREFSHSTNVKFPLRPIKQKKTIPIKNPRRPHLPDPITTDPTAQRFQLSDHPEAMLVIREPSGIPNLSDNLVKFNTTQINQNNNNDNQLNEQQLTLSHPALSKLSNISYNNQSSSFNLPPRLRKIKEYKNSITPENLKEIQNLRLNNSLTQLSSNNNSIRNQIHIKNQMKFIRKQSKWSVAKLIKRQEKMIRRSMW